jgi:hypothetical protein
MVEDSAPIQLVDVVVPAQPAASPATADEADSATGAGPCDEVIEALRVAREENGHLREALLSNRDIGAATGILMALRGLTQPLAFDELRRSSQQTHRKLRDVAADVLRTGVLPTS